MLKRLRSDVRIARRDGEGGAEIVMEVEDGEGVGLEGLSPWIHH